MTGQVFISYRRDGGFEMARLIRDSLQKKGYKIFLDVEELRSGPFNTAIFEQVESSSDVIAILTPGSLDRCWQENDWMRLEVAHAIKLKKNIVPVITRGFKWPSQPLPEDLASLRSFNGLEPSHDYFDASMDKLTKLLVGYSKRVYCMPLIIALTVLFMIIGAGIILSGLWRSEKYSVNSPETNIVKSPAHPPLNEPIPKQKPPVEQKKEEAKKVTKTKTTTDTKKEQISTEDIKGITVKDQKQPKNHITPTSSPEKSEKTYSATLVFKTGMSSDYDLIGFIETSQGKYPVVKFYQEISKKGEYYVGLGESDVHFSNIRAVVFGGRVDYAQQYIEISIEYKNGKKENGIVPDHFTFNGYDSTLPEPYNKVRVDRLKSVVFQK